MKTSALSTYDEKQLQQKVIDEQEELRKIKFAHRISAIDNPVKIKAVRRSIARLKTELRARQLREITV